MIVSPAHSTLHENRSAFITQALACGLSEVENCELSTLDEPLVNDRVNYVLGHLASATERQNNDLQGNPDACR